MIDYIRSMNLNIDPSTILNNKLLRFPQLIDPKTGEIINRNRYAAYKGLRFTVSTDGNLRLSGSLHMYKNNGEHNHDDFIYADLVDVVQELNKEFGIDPWRVSINNIEIGVNIQLPYSADRFIDSLVTHSYLQFIPQIEYNKHYSQVKYDQYHIKIYNKGKQYKLKKNLLRFEIKIVRMAKLKAYGISELIDILDYDKLYSLKDLLLDVFKDIIFFDSTIDTEQTEDSSKELLRNGSNPNYWKVYKDKTGSNASKGLRRYQSLVRKYGTQNHHEVADLISQKWEQLLGKKEEAIRVLTEFQKKLSDPGIRDLTEIQPSTQEDNPLPI